MILVCFIAGNRSIKLYMVLTSWKVQLDLMAELIFSPFQKSHLEENSVSLLETGSGQKAQLGNTKVSHL